MKKLFKNAKLVDIENEEVYETDILVENGKFKSFNVQENFEGETVDLKGDFVLPSFVNSFLNSVEAFKDNYYEYGGEALTDKVKSLFEIKNLLTGAIFYNDISTSGEFLLDKIEEKDEKTLSKLSVDAVENKKTPFLKFGQDLQSLGTVDKEFGKPATNVLEDFGFLDRKAVVVGGNCLEKDDLELLRQSDCDFIVLPNEDGKLGRRHINLVSLMSKEFNIALGSGNSSEIDFFAFLRKLICDTRSLFEDESCITEKQALLMATNGSILKLENELKEGLDATFIVVDGRESLYDNVFKTLVWERSKQDVKMCVRKGEVLQKNGKIFMKNLADYATIIRNLKH